LTRIAECAPRRSETVRVEIELTYGSIIRGDVTWVGGDPVLSEDRIEVLAIPLAADTGVARTSKLAEWSPEVCHAIVDDSGAFQFDQADPESCYRLLAYGPNIISTVKPITCNFAQPQQLVVARLCAAEVAIVDGQVGPKAAPGAYGPRGGGLFAIDREGIVDAFLFDELDAALAGWDASLTHWAQRDARLVAYLGSEDSKALGPFRFTADIPGYDMALAEFQLPCLEAPPRIEVPLHQRTEGWATIVVNFHGLPPGPPTLNSPFAVLHLHSVNQPQDEIASVPIRYPGSASTERVTGLPVGAYVLEVVIGPLNVVRRIEQPIVLGVGAVEEVTLDLSDLGSLEVIVKDARGRKFCGNVVIELCRADAPAGESGRYLRFYQSPYVISGLPEGPRLVRTNWVFPSSTEELTEAMADVRPGLRETVELVESH
jgi:hypothetical protein